VKAVKLRGASSKWKPAMSKKAEESKKAEDERCKVERELDRQLEDTFPASDPLKISRRPPSSKDANNNREPGKDDKQAHTVAFKPLPVKHEREPRGPNAF
jgi:hypothetical protein